MLHYIALYPNQYSEGMNDEIILGTQDVPMEDFIIMAMSEFEAIGNIKIESVEVVHDQDEVDINRHMVNINFKKKDWDLVDIPKLKYTTDSRFGEIIFTIRITTNLNEKVIVKRILFPIEHEGHFWNNGKRMKAIWQLVDASTYSQRGKNTLKSRLPIIVYQNKKRVIMDIDENPHMCSQYSYAQNVRTKRPGAKAKAKFLNPIMIFSAKMGWQNTAKFYGLDKVIFPVATVLDDKDMYYYFPWNELFLKVDKAIFEKYDYVRSFICMTYHLSSKDFPVTLKNMNNPDYWVCRIGAIGAKKSKTLSTFKEKGITTLLMIEQLLDKTTIMNLRLPHYYKHNIYYLLYWIMTNFDALRQKSNIDMANKRIRKNEYIVNSSLGKKINENIIRLIERRGKSRMNTMETLLELFNFGSDIIVSGMRNLNDLIKSDDLVNDNDFILDTAFSSKGYQSLGEGNGKKIAVKYRYIHPSMAGILDLNTSSNSDIGLSGSFTPFAQTYDGFYFTPEHEPCDARYHFDCALSEDGVINLEDSDFDSYIARITAEDEFAEMLKPIPILIVEKESPSKDYAVPEYTSIEDYQQLMDEGDTAEEGTE